MYHTSPCVFRLVWISLFNLNVHMINFRKLLVCVLFTFIQKQKYSFFILYDLTRDSKKNVNFNLWQHLSFFFLWCVEILGVEKIILGRIAQLSSLYKNFYAFYKFRPIIKMNSNDNVCKLNISHFPLNDFDKFKIFGLNQLAAFVQIYDT